MAFECGVCGKPNSKFFRRCGDHYLCDDCGTREGLCTYTEGVLCDPCHEKRAEKRVAEFDGDTDFTAEITCPHCGYQKSDSWEASEGDTECEDCGRKYVVTRNVEVTYSTEKIGA